MIYLHKILPLFLMPIMVVILLIVIGLYKKRNSLIYLQSHYYIYITPIFSDAFFKLVEGDQSRKSIASIEKADAIVVLSGMLSIHEIDGRNTLNGVTLIAFLEGVRLMKAGKAHKLNLHRCQNALGQVQQDSRVRY